MNFATLKSLTIPEGVVTQITDASGRVIWAAGGGKVILEVEKITDDTYDGTTLHTGEQFILLDIYPKTNGTVKVTYGGLTKIITDTSGVEEPNAIQVFFGTFNGVADSVETPASGELTIEGDYSAFACSQFEDSNKAMFATLWGGVLEIKDFGAVKAIPPLAFGSATNGACKNITTINIPSKVKEIGGQAFYQCEGLISVIIASEKIGSAAFCVCSNLATANLASGVKEIGRNAFGNCDKLLSISVLSTEPPELISTSSDDGTISFSQFPTNEGMKIYVPKGCGNTYKTAEGWSTYADYIVEAS